MDVLSGRSVAPAWSSPDGDPLLTDVATGPVMGPDCDLDGPPGPTLGADRPRQPEPAGLQTGLSVPLSCDLLMERSEHDGAPHVPPACRR